MGQWVVTKHGLECRAAGYDIPVSRLWDGEGSHGWLEQMRVKQWVNMPDFARALDDARRRHTPERYARTRGGEVA